MPGVVEVAGERDVIDVVTGGIRQRPVLPPAREPPIGQARVALEAHLGPEPQPLHDARPETFDESVRVLDQPQHDLGRARLLQVHGNRTLAAPRQVVLRLRIERQRPALAVHQHDLGAKVGEQHAAERPRADAGHFDDPGALQWSHHSDRATISFITSLAPP